MGKGDQLYGDGRNDTSSGEHTEEYRTRNIQLHIWNLYKYYKLTLLQENNKYIEKKSSVWNTIRGDSVSKNTTPFIIKQPNYYLSDPNKLKTLVSSEISWVTYERKYLSVISISHII